MCQSMVDIQPVAAEIRQGKKIEDRNNRAKIKWSALLHRATIKIKKTTKTAVNHAATASIDLVRKR